MFVSWNDLDSFDRREHDVELILDLSDEIKDLFLIPITKRIRSSELRIIDDSDRARHAGIRAHPDTEFLCHRDVL